LSWAILDESFVAAEAIVTNGLKLSEFKLVGFSSSKAN
jgi:hypothetical protein